MQCASFQLARTSSANELVWMQEATRMTCILSSYLEEQTFTCLRIAKSANEGTQAQQEWLRTAQVLIDRTQHHKKICGKCKMSAVEIKLSESSVPRKEK